MKGTPGLEPGASSCVLHWGQELSGRVHNEGNARIWTRRLLICSQPLEPLSYVPCNASGPRNSVPGFHERLGFRGRFKDARGPRESVWNVKGFHTARIDLRWGAHGFTCKDFHAWVHTLMQPQKEVCLAAIAPLRCTSWTKVQPPPQPCGSPTEPTIFGSRPDALSIRPRRPLPCQ